MKRNIHAAITAIGAYVPEKVLTNTDLEGMVDTNDAWIRSRTGIVERRILEPKSLGTSYMCIQAAKELITKATLDPSEIDLVLVATATPDMPVAASAAYVASEIGAVNAFGFDIQAACSGFLYGMSTASAYIGSGNYNKILLIGADMMSSIVDYEDRATCIIFGDGAGAVLFEPNYEGLGLQDEYLRSDGIGRDFLSVQAGGSVLPASTKTVRNKQHFLKQDGKTVFKYAVSNMSDAARALMNKNKLTQHNINYLVPHQANKRIIDAVAKRLNIEHSKVLMNIKHYGNTTAATLPLLLYDYEHIFKKGDNLIFAAFGGGFTWGASYLKWANTTNN